MVTRRRAGDGLTAAQAAGKRLLDISASVTGLLLLSWLIAIAWLVAALETRSNGFFVQDRIGRWGEPFTAVKIKTMRSSSIGTTITTRNDPRITRSGAFFRRTKIDELPQLWNVLVGNMSLVGPRPDVPGFADMLTGQSRLVLSIRPGITGPASLKYRDEEQLLASVDDPEAYNRDVIFPDKVEINLEYIKNYSLTRDIYIIYQTIMEG